MAQQNWVNQLDTVATVQNFKKKKKRDKVAQQNGTLDVQHKNPWCTVIYIKGKKKYKQKTKKKKKSYYSYNAAWYCNYCSKKKEKTKWLTKMEL